MPCAEKICGSTTNLYQLMNPLEREVGKLTSRELSTTELAAKTVTKHWLGNVFLHVFLL